MSQSRKRRAAIFARTDGKCIYCGGQTNATTIDHMPPRVMFNGRDRPAGLEFPSCGPCNHGAKLADLICAAIGRVYPDATTSGEEAEISNLLMSIRNNIPGALEEMFVPQAQQELARQRLGMAPRDGGFLRLDGPIILGKMETFAARLGFALHFEKTGNIVPPWGGVLVRVYSNVDLLEGKVPDELFDILPAPNTLRAGRKHVEDQFLFGTRPATGGGMSMSFASFRRSFAVLAATTMDIARLERLGLPGDATPFRPGGIKAW